MTDLKAIEFFSGIGAFAQAARAFPIEIVAAYDQSRDANLVYELNHGLKPRPRNLDSIAADDIPEADLWWMSPPCTPFSRRGKRSDEADPRARSFLRLIELIERLRPRYLLLENVGGFVGSGVHRRLTGALERCSYHVGEVDLCSTDFGTPMRRPRHFVVAVAAPATLPGITVPGITVPGITVPGITVPGITGPPASITMAELAGFLDADPRQELLLAQATTARYGGALNVVDPSDPDARLICFTSNYWKSYRAGGSFLPAKGGGLRRLSPTEMLRLFGFPEGFAFPEAVGQNARYRLIGNSVDVRCVRHLLASSVALDPDLLTTLTDRVD